MAVLQSAFRCQQIFSLFLPESVRFLKQPWLQKFFQLSPQAVLSLSFFPYYLPASTHAELSSAGKYYRRFSGQIFHLLPGKHTRLPTRKKLHPVNDVHAAGCLVWGINYFVKYGQPAICVFTRNLKI